MTHLLEAGYDIRKVQGLLGHKDVSTTMIDCRAVRTLPAGSAEAASSAAGHLGSHVLNRPEIVVRSPLD